MSPRPFLNSASRHLRQAQTPTGEELWAADAITDANTQRILHRYVFLLFQQPPGFDERAAKFVNATTSVQDFSIAQFADEVGLGDPLGGSFIRVGPDPSA